MRLTQAHVDFWTYHKLPAGLRAGLARPLARPSIDAIVNGHAEPSRRRATTEPAATMCILRVYRRIGHPFDLVSLLDDPNQPKRHAYVRRWLRRINPTPWRD